MLWKTIYFSANLTYVLQQCFFSSLVKYTDLEILKKLNTSTCTTDNFEGFKSSRNPE